MSFQWWVSPSSPTAYAHHNIKLDFYHRRANHKVKVGVNRQHDMIWLSLPFGEDGGRSSDVTGNLQNNYPSAEYFVRLGGLMWIVDLLCSNVKEVPLQSVTHAFQGSTHHSPISSTFPLLFIGCAAVHLSKFIFHLHHQTYFSSIHPAFSIPPPPQKGVVYIRMLTIF